MGREVVRWRAPSWAQSPGACCDLHVDGPPGTCCDPNDCGPCCEHCPTCPTLTRARRHDCGTC